MGENRRLLTNNSLYTRSRTIAAVQDCYSWSTSSGTRAVVWHDSGYFSTWNTLKIAQPWYDGRQTRLGLDLLFHLENDGNLVVVRYGTGATFSPETPGRSPAFVQVSMDKVREPTFPPFCHLFSSSSRPPCSQTHDAPSLLLLLLLFSSTSNE